MKSSRISNTTLVSDGWTRLSLRSFISNELRKEKSMLLEAYKLYKKYKLDKVKQVYMIETYKLAKKHKLLVKVGKEEMKISYKLPKDVKLIDIKLFNIDDDNCIRYLYEDPDNNQQYIVVREIELER